MAALVSTHLDDALAAVEGVAEVLEQEAATRLQNKSFIRKVRADNVPVQSRTVLCCVCCVVFVLSEKVSPVRTDLETKSNLETS